MVKAPCKDCADRDLGCHSTCGPYKEYKEMYQRGVEAMKRERDAVNNYVSFQIERREHARRTHHKPK